MARTEFNIRPSHVQLLQKRPMICSDQVIKAAHKDKDHRRIRIALIKYLLHRVGDQIIVAINDIALAQVKIMKTFLQSMHHCADCPMPPAGAGTYKKLDTLGSQHSNPHNTPVSMPR